jgi:hypothetical protein
MLAGTEADPIDEGFVLRQKDWLCSSDADYDSGKGLLEIMFG